jgi:hypothetical protein
VLGSPRTCSGLAYSGVSAANPVVGAGGRRIEQLRIAVRRHQHVGGLQIAVNHQVAMCVLDRFIDFKEQAQTRDAIEPRSTR